MGRTSGHCLETFTLANLLIISCYNTHWPSQHPPSLFIFLILSLSLPALMYRRLVTGVASRMPKFDHRPVRVMCVVEEVSFVQVFLPVLQFSPVSIIPPLLHTHPSIYHPHCIMFFSQYFSFTLSVSSHLRETYRAEVIY